MLCCKIQSCVRTLRKTAQIITNWTIILYSINFPRLPNLQKDPRIRRVIITNIPVNIHIAFHNRERRYISYPACGSRNKYDRDIWEPLDTRTSALYSSFNGFFVCYLDVLVTYKMQANKMKGVISREVGHALRRKRMMFHSKIKWT